MQQYITFEVMEGAYDISCPDPDCPTQVIITITIIDITTIITMSLIITVQHLVSQGVLTQHQMERLTDKELLDKHRTFRCN